MQVQIPTPEYLAGYKTKPHLQEYFNAQARFKVIEWHRGSEKTSALINHILIEAHQEVGLYWLVGPYLNQTLDTVWKDPSTAIFRWIPELYLKHLKVNNSDHSITLPNRSVVQIKGADNPDSLRGPKPKGIGVDEYGEIAKRHGSMFREAVLEPSVRSSGGWIHYAGTPKGQTDLEVIRQKDDIEWWSSVKTVEDTGIYTAEEIAKIKGGMTNLDLFYQEYYCRVLEGASSVFKGVHQCIKGELEDPQLYHEYVFGIDLARSFDRTAIVGFDINSNHLVYFKLLENTPWERQNMHIMDVLQRYNGATAYVDATGGYDAFVDELSRSGAPVVPFKISSNAIKRDLVERLGMFISNTYITFPSVPDIIDELQAFEYAVTRNNNVTYNAPVGKHDDIVMAMALAVQRLSHSAPPPHVPGFNEEIEVRRLTDDRTGYLRT